MRASQRSKGKGQGKRSTPKPTSELPQGQATVSTTDVTVMEKVRERESLMSLENGESFKSKLEGLTAQEQTSTPVKAINDMLEMGCWAKENGQRQQTKMQGSLFSQVAPTEGQPPKGAVSAPPPAAQLQPESQPGTSHAPATQVGPATGDGGWADDDFPPISQLSGYRTPTKAERKQQSQGKKAPGVSLSPGVISVVDLSSDEEGTGEQTSTNKDNGSASITKEIKKERMEEEGTPGYEPDKGLQPGHLPMVCSVSMDDLNNLGNGDQDSMETDEPGQASTLQKAMSVQAAAVLAYQATKPRVHVPKDPNMLSPCTGARKRPETPDSATSVDAVEKVAKETKRLETQVEESAESDTDCLGDTDPEEGPSKKSQYQKKSAERSQDKEENKEADTATGEPSKSDFTPQQLRLMADGLWPTQTAFNAFLRMTDRTDDNKVDCLKNCLAEESGDFTQALLRWQGSFGQVPTSWPKAMSREHAAFITELGKIAKDTTSPEAAAKRRLRQYADLKQKEEKLVREVLKETEMIKQSECAKTTGSVNWELVRECNNRYEKAHKESVQRLAGPKAMAEQARTLLDKLAAERTEAKRAKERAERSRHEQAREQTEDRKRSRSRGASRWDSDYARVDSLDSTERTPKSARKTPPPLSKQDMAEALKRARNSREANNSRENVRFDTSGVSTMNSSRNSSDGGISFLSRFGRDRDYRQNDRRRSPMKRRSSPERSNGDLDQAATRGRWEDRRDRGSGRARSRTPSGPRVNEKNLVVVYVKEILEEGTAVVVDSGTLPMPKWVYAECHPSFTRKIIQEMRVAKATGRDPPHSLGTINWAPRGPSYIMYGMIECDRANDVQRVIDVCSGLLIKGQNDKDREHIRDFKIEARRYVDMPNKRVNLTLMMFNRGFLSEDPETAQEDAQLCVDQACADAGLPPLDEAQGSFATVFKVKYEESDRAGESARSQEFNRQKGRWLIKFKVSEEAAKKLRDVCRGRLVICGCEYVVRHQTEELCDPHCVLTTSPESLFGPTPDQE